MPSTEGCDSTPQRGAERGRRHALSPGYRSRKSLGGATNNTMETEGDIPQNDDEAELRERQRNRLAEIQQRSLGSPGTPGEVRRSLSGKLAVSNIAVTEHYANCIKLSAENKINAKNAFQLHLIDYMTDMLRKKDSEMSNFQVASCTLDASAKIYAYRVDCVHSDTLKMAGGLGRSKQTSEEEKNKDDEEEGGGEGEEQAPETKKRKAKKSKTVETNLKNINVNKFDLEFEVDPLFKKSSAMFDEGRAGGGQFVTALMMKDDSCQLLLDSDYVFSLTKEFPSCPKDSNVTIPKLSDMEDRVICPTFDGFSFLHWDPSREEDNLVGSKRKSDAMDKEHAFDLNAPTEPVPELDDLPCPADDFAGLDEIEDEERDGLGPLGNRTLGPINRTAAQSFSVIEHLSAVPLEYSYFDKNKNTNLGWAGPMHLRFRPQKGLSAVPPGTEKKKRRKEVTGTDFPDGVDLTRHLIRTKAVICLSNSTVRGWPRDKTTALEDLQYKVANFYKQFMRPEVSLFLRNPDAVPLGPEEDKHMENYNYENENDVANFCPPPDDDGDANPFDGDTSQFFDEPVSQTTPLPPVLTEGEVPDFLGDALVAAPNKVALIDIGYARTAKKMNMKKLKTAMWAVLTGEEGNSNLRLDAPELLPSTMKTPKTFSALYKDVPKILPNQMRENLSVPLAFVGFLHLANEHSLALEGREDMSDFRIEQD